MLAKSRLELLRKRHQLETAESKLRKEEERIEELLSAWRREILGEGQGASLPSRLIPSSRGTHCWSGAMGR
jgi:hypothetical protein